MNAKQLKANFARRARHATVKLVEGKVILGVPTQAKNTPSEADYAWHKKEAARLGARVESVTRKNGRWVLVVSPA